MEGYKGLLSSKTIWMGIIGVLASLLGGTWVALKDPAFQQQLVEIAIMGVTFVTSVLTILSRYSSTKQLTTDRALIEATKEAESKTVEERLEGGQL